MARPISSITIVGGGTTGWLAALFLSTRFAAEVKSGAMTIALIESARIPIIGVGESLSPSMVDTLQSLGVNEYDFIRETDASFKLAGYFVNWDAADGPQPSSWVNPFVAFTGAGLEFERFEVPLGADYGRTVSPCREAIEQRLGPKVHGQGPYQAILRYAYHTDAGKFAPFLATLAKQRGVEQIIDDVVDVRLDERGFVASLSLEQKGEWPVDLVIDASGFAGVVLNEALGVPMVDYGRHLINDRAVVTQLAYADPDEDIEPATRATALSSGWAFRVPLFGRTGNGYVYSSSFIDDDQAASEFVSYLGGAADERQCRHIRMRVGRAERTWVKNCVAMGLAAGFVEPLEASAIYSVETSLKWLFHYFPDGDYSPALQDRYNARTAALYDEVVDYIVLHYAVSTREDTPYWRAQRSEVELPERLAANLQVWKRTLPVRGDFPSVTYFDESTYTAALLGKHFYAGASLHPERQLDRSEWEQRKASIAQTHRAALARLPGHRDLLSRIRQAA